MKQRVDMSIGQRLGIGFGFLLLILLAFVAVVAYWQSKSTEAEDALRDNILPLKHYADAIERDVLYVAINVRMYLRVLNAERLQRFHDAVRHARDNLQRLKGHSGSAEGASMFRPLEATVSRYLDEATRLVERAPSGTPITVAEEEALGEARALAIQRVAQFVHQQDENLQTGIDAMASARNKVADALIITSLLTALLFAVVVYLISRSIRQPTKRLLQVAGALEAGDWRPALAWAPGANGGGLPRAVRNELIHLGRAFGAAAAALEQREQRLRADGEVAAAAASSLDKEQIASLALAHIAEHVKAEAGVIYWAESDRDRLIPIARRAMDDNLRPVSVGEGLPGQAAKERRSVVVGDIPFDTAFSINFGRDRVAPKSIAAVPLAVGDQLQGVMVLASLRPFDDSTLSFLEVSAISLGTGLQNARGHAEVREKNEQIQAQNEELQVQNEEIQAQSEEIQVQNEEIQAQHEEIQRQNEELKQYTEELLEAGERKNEFLGVLAHELRNPLAAITNGLYVLGRTPPDSAPARRAVAIMERQAQQLIRLIDDLLDITRISQGKLDLNRRPVDLGEVVRMCLEDQRAVLEEGVLRVDLPEHAVWVEGDHARLCQVIGNLLHNAVKFTDAKREIAIVMQADRQRREAVLRIIDNGIGIEPGLLAQVFQPFNQGSAAHGRGNTGLGLGLALVKQLVELHGGAVHAHSHGVGQGAEFIVRLPMIEPRAAATEEADVKTDRTSETRRILVVEDNADVASSLRDMLAVEGHVVEVVASGVHALERAHAFRPDIILCDIGLPEMSGYEVVKRFRSDDRLRSACLIALTGYASPADVSRAQKAGFDYHLAKPLNIERLREILVKVAGRGSESMSRN